MYQLSRCALALAFILDINLLILGELDVLFFFNVAATNEIYTLSLHDALPICTGKDVNSHTVLDGIITTIMATIQRINIIGSREGSRNRRRLKANQTGKKFRVGIKSNISTNRNNLISGVDRCIHLNAMKKT